jgi:7-keto-8-aminopelargonate synthetase-like enzyme/alkylation response protein AidB-like acyl-CoA dehydrogenase/acyl carrier protein
MTPPAPAGRSTLDLIAWLKNYAQAKINSRLADERRSIQPNVLLDFGDRGLFGLVIAVSKGGFGASHAEAALIMQQLAAIDTSLAAMVGIHNALGLTILDSFDGIDIRPFAEGRKILALAVSEKGAGSNPRAIETIARRNANGWTLSGQKSWIGLAGWAAALVVLAREFDGEKELGLRCFFVRTDQIGICIGDEAMTMGVRAIVQNEIIFTDVLLAPESALGEAGTGFTTIRKAFQMGRLFIGAASIGVMKRCFQSAAHFAAHRLISGRKLIEFPITRQHLFTIDKYIDISEALVRVALTNADGADRSKNDMLFGIIKALIPELAWLVADRAMQMLGARGYVESNGVAQVLRDTRLFRIFEGPTETIEAFIGAAVNARGEDLRSAFAEYYKAPELLVTIMEAVEAANKAATNSDEAEIVAAQAGRAVAWAAALGAVKLLNARPSTITFASERFKLAIEEISSGAGRIALDAEEIRNRCLEFDSQAADIRQNETFYSWQRDPLTHADAGNATRPATSSRLLTSGAPSEPLDDRPVLPLNNIIQPLAGQPLLHLPLLVTNPVETWIADWLNEHAAYASKGDTGVSLTSLGLDSIKLLTFSLDFEKHFGLQLDERDIYSTETISEMARRLNTLSSKASNPAAAAPRPVAVRSNAPSCEEFTSSLRDGEVIPFLTGAAAGLDFRRRGILGLFGVDAHRRFFSPGIDVGILNGSGRRGLLFSHDGDDTAGPSAAIFSVNHYLGLNRHPEVIKAAIEASRQYGTGAGTSPVSGGFSDVHIKLERELTKFVGVEAGILMPTGFTANLAAIVAMVGRGKPVILDEACHASIFEGCRLAGANITTIPHNDLVRLDAVLRTTGAELVVMESIYSMGEEDGDLAGILKAVKRHGARLMVDESHSFGLYGSAGAGFCERVGLIGQVDLYMTTLSKSAASIGGFLGGSAALINWIRYSSRSYLFQATIPPAAAAAALMALRLIESSEGDELRRRLWQNTDYFRSGLIDAGFDVKGTSPIVAVHAQSACSAFRLVKALRNKGVFTPAVTYPAVARNDSRLRFTISAHHEREDLDQAIKALIDVRLENLQSVEKPLNLGKTTLSVMTSQSERWRFFKEKLSKASDSANWQLELKAGSFEVTDRSLGTSVSFVDRNARFNALDIEANDILCAVLRREIDIFGSLDLFADVLAAAS